MTHLTLENKGMEAHNKGSCEKDKIRQWQRNKEVHPLAFYETFHLSEHYFDEDSVSDSFFSYSDSDFGSDYYNEEISMDDLTERKKNLHIESRPFILPSNNQTNEFIIDIPNTKNKSILNSVSKTTSIGNVISKKI